MRESVLQAGWESHALRGRCYITVCGQKIELLHPGIPNPGSGPDFECGLIRIGNLIFAGNIELHLKREDYFIHNHEKDPAYSNLLLHVFLRRSRRDRVIPGVAFEISLEENGIEPGMFERKTSVLKELYCGKKALRMRGSQVEDMISELVLARMEERRMQVADILQSHQNDWQQAYLWLTARVFGRGDNGDIFAALTAILNGKQWLKKRNKTDFLKKLLEANSGLFQPNHQKVLQNKRQSSFHYSPNEIQKNINGNFIWKKGKIMPGSSPADMIEHFVNFLPVLALGFHAFPAMQPGKEPLEYILKHSRINVQAEQNANKRSLTRHQTLANSLMINAIAPIVYSYGKQMGNRSYSDWAVRQLRQMTSEDHYITRLFKKAGFNASNAADSQAFIFLYRNFCLKGNCKRCTIHHSE